MFYINAITRVDLNQVTQIGYFSEDGLVEFGYVKKYTSHRIFVCFREYNKWISIPNDRLTLDSSSKDMLIMPPPPTPRTAEMEISLITSNWTRHLDIHCIIPMEINQIIFKFQIIDCLKLFRIKYNYQTRCNTIEIAMVGAFESGKTSIINSFRFGQFDINKNCDVVIKQITVNGIKYRLRIWDIYRSPDSDWFPRTERGRGRRQQIYPHVVIIVADLKHDQLNLDCFLKHWTGSKTNNRIKESEYESLNCLVGNKLDEQKHCITEREMIETARKYELSFYGMVSARTGKNIAKTFESITDNVITCCPNWKQKL